MKFQKKKILKFSKTMEKLTIKFPEFFFEISFKNFNEILKNFDLQNFLEKLNEFL